MAYSLVLLKFLAKGALNMVTAGVGGDLMCEVLPEIAADVWKRWHGERDARQRQEDLAALAAAAPADVKAQVKEAVKEVAGDQPLNTQEALALYLSFIPDQIRKSLRRPADPAGATCPFEMIPQTSDDVMNLLPARLPRFKPGDCPLPGVDWELHELLGAGG